MVNRTVGTINSNVRGLSPADAHRIDESLHRLQWNENPFDFPADLKEEVLQRMASADWARYPTMIRPFELIDALARHLSVAPESVVVGSGSSDLIRITMSAFLQQGDSLVMPSPTFLLYRRNGRMLGANLCEVSCDPQQDFALPVDELIVLARTNQAKLVVLCAPNNPTGTIYALADLRRLVEECGAPVLIDEAYAEFCGQNLLPLQAEYDNVILIRTFSKAFSMAGVRVGYAVAAPAVAIELQKIVSAFPISVFSETVARAALDHHARFMDAVTRIVAERERLARNLAALPGLRVFSSGTNFLLVRPDAPARPILDHLLHKQRVLLSDAGGYPELDNYLRISVGATDENDLVVQGFRECLGGGS